MEHHNDILFFNMNTPKDRRRYHSRSLIAYATIIAGMISGLQAFGQSRLDVMAGLHMNGHNATTAVADSVVISVPGLGDETGAHLAVNYEGFIRPVKNFGVKLLYHVRYITYSFHNYLDANPLGYIHKVGGPSFHTINISPSYTVYPGRFRGNLGVYAGVTGSLHIPTKDTRSNEYVNLEKGDTEVEQVYNIMVRDRALQPSSLSYSLGVKYTIKRITLELSRNQSLTNVTRNVNYKNYPIDINLRTAYVFFSVGYRVVSKE